MITYITAPRCCQYIHQDNPLLLLRNACFGSYLCVGCSASPQPLAHSSISTDRLHSAEAVGWLRHQSQRAKSTPRSCGCYFSDQGLSDQRQTPGKSELPECRYQTCIHDARIGQRLVVGRGASDNTAIQGAQSISSLTVSLVQGKPVNSIASESVKEITSRSESYILSVPSDGSSASLTANSTLGLFRGLTTFGQLWYYYGGDIYTLEAPVEITDTPAYVCLIYVCHPRLLKYII